MSVWEITEYNQLNKKDQSAYQWCLLIDSVNEYESEKWALRACMVIKFNLDEE